MVRPPIAAHYSVAHSCGVEGPTDDDEVLDLRYRQMRNFLATLLFSQGVPMLGHGHRSRAPNELSWVNWELDERRRSLLGFVGHIVALRHRHPNLRRRKYFFGRPIHGSEIKDITWVRPDGQEMSDEDWDAGWLRCFGLRLGDVLGEVNENGEVVTDDALLLLLNAHHEPLPFLIPPDLPGTWEVEVDTAAPDGRGATRRCAAGGTFEIADRSLVLLRLRR
jgi:glycogen operon protein